MLDGWGRSRDAARVVLSLVDLRVKYDAGQDRDVLALLISSIRKMGLPLFETFVSRSAKVESLYTNPEGRPRSILHGAPHSLVNRQMMLLAQDVLRAVDPDGSLRGTPCAPTQEAPPMAAAPSALPFLELRGLTPEAKEALAAPALRIERLPFRIGRLDAATPNDLMIRDRAPWQVSRSHAQIVRVDGRIGVIDLGSRLGTAVDGQRIGGSQRDPGPAFLPDDGGRIVLGSSRSPFAFEVRIGRSDAHPA
jgi:hypothetical protein